MRRSNHYASEDWPAPVATVAAPSSVLTGPVSETRMRQRLSLRVFSLLGLAAVALSFPSVGDNRFWLAALLVGLTPVLVLLPRLVSPDRWMLAQSVFDVTATVLLVGFVPNVWAAGLVIVVCSPAASCALLGRRAYIGLEVFGLVGIGIAGHLTGAPNWVVPWAVAALMVPLVASYVDVFLVQEQSASARLDDVANSASAVFWEAEASTGAFLRISGRVSDVFGYEPEDLPADLPSLLIAEDRQKWWEHVLDDADDQFVLECRSAGIDGQITWLRLHVRRVAVRGRHVLRGMAFDVTALAESNEEVRRRAETDHLTGLPNRFVLLEALEKRLGAGQRFSLLILDLDRFKDINDTLGHQSGDLYLQIIARRLKDAVGADGMVARMGGDEFAAVLGNGEGLDQTIAIARRLTNVCGTPVDIAGIDFSGSASCGIAIAPLHGNAANDLLRRADLAMYTAKRTSVGVHVFEFAADESNLDRLRLSGEAELALTEGQMKLWFQPKVELTTGRIVGAEALLRWHHPGRGILLPGEFLDIVELSKHRRILCQTIIGQSVDCLAATRNYAGGLSVALNVSFRDLLDPGFAEVITSLLDKANVPADRLTLEITERDLMYDRTGFERAATVVKSTGVRLSIDDFGTGHSSLLRLHQLPVDELKIDRSFIAQLGVEPQADIIVESIIELGNSLGHQVVAEGIERKYEVEKLRSLGCHTGQGYLYSAALPRDEFIQLLDKPATT